MLTVSETHLASSLLAKFLLLASQGIIAVLLGGDHRYRMSSILFPDS